jgi:hypothetical protein
MATDKLFTVAGTSRHPSLGYKVRFANDALRVKNLAKNDHTDIILVELPRAMTKMAALVFIKSLDEFSGVAEQTAIADYVDSHTGTTKSTRTKVDSPVQHTVEHSAPGFEEELRSTVRAG